MTGLDDAVVEEEEEAAAAVVPEEEDVEIEGVTRDLGTGGGPLDAAADTAGFSEVFSSILPISASKRAISASKSSISDTKLSADLIIDA